MSVKNERVEGSTASSDSKPVEHDATGRMISPGETQRRERITQRGKDVPIPERKPMTPEVKSALDKTQADLDGFDDNGYKLSSKFLRHYLENKGTPLKIDSKDIESSTLYQKAIKTNQKRFEDSMIKGLVDAKMHDGKFIQKIEGTPSKFKDQILNLKDGETVSLNNPRVKNAGDAWDRDIDRIESYAHDPDHARALGAVKLRSLGELQATRKGNKVEITGEVYHTINDRYDFNDDTLADKVLFKRHRILAKEGYAKPFQVYGHKPQKVTGTLEIKDGRIVNPKFRWENIRD